METKQCPNCAEEIKLEAMACRYCGCQFAGDDVAAVIAEREKRITEQRREARRQAFIDEKRLQLKKLKSSVAARSKTGLVALLIGGILFVYGFFLTSLLFSPETEGPAFLISLFLGVVLPLIGISLLNSAGSLAAKVRHLDEEVDEIAKRPLESF